MHIDTSFVLAAEYRTVGGVSGPLVIVEAVKVCILAPAFGR